MALAGSQAVTNEELIFDRIKNEATNQIKDIDFNNNDDFDKKMDGNISRYKKACDYNLTMLQALRDYKNAKSKFFIKLKRGEEKAPEIKDTIADLELPRIKTIKTDNRVKEAVKPTTGEKKSNDIDENISQSLTY
jgi:hypothetical protein